MSEYVYGYGFGDIASVLDGTIKKNHEFIMKKIKEMEDEDQTKKTSPIIEDTNGNGGGSVGWICPVCGRGLSPYTNFCPCKGWGKMILTCETTSVYELPSH